MGSKEPPGGPFCIVFYKEFCLSGCRRRYLQRSILGLQKSAQKWYQNGSKTGPKMGPGRPPEAPQRPHRGLARSCAVPRAPAQSLFLLLVLALLLFVFLVLVLFFCVLLFLFVHSFVLYVFMCACFWLCVLFPVVVFLFYAFVFAMFEECLAVSGATSKRHATCSRMSPSGLLEMLIRLECVGSAPVVTVPL